jgi:hypothetical protein
VARTQIELLEVREEGKVLEKSMGNALDDAPNPGMEWNRPGLQPQKGVLVFKTGYQW